MPTVVCPTCGATVRFEGVTGLCPVCAAVVRVKRKAPVPAGQPQVQPPKSRGRSRGPVDLSQVEMDPDADFAPSSSSDGKRPVDPLILYLSVGAGAVLLVFGIYVALQMLLSRPAKPVAALPAPPPPSIAQTEEGPPPAEQPPAPAPVTQPVQVVVAPPPVALPAWMSVKPVRPAPKDPPISDAKVGTAITRAVAYLKSQFTDDQLINPSASVSDEYTGLDTLVVYSLLHAGEAISDSDLDISSPFMQRALNRTRQYEMNSDKSVYCRALRASALAMFNRDVDATQLGRDRKWLLDAAVSGAYGYSMPPKGSKIDSIRWDNSCSQYGVLGIWATVQAGIPAPEKFWNDIENHWLTCQNTDGSWAYQTSDGSLTMTCGGVTSLCVTAEQLELIASKGKKDAHPQMSEAVNKALAWIGTDDNITKFSGSYKGYTLYGIERAALATGYRWFGAHDWYRELGAKEIQNQDLAGSWQDSPMETAFRVLFFSRGRQPIFMNKLRFDGDWNDRPRDAAKMTQFATAQLEKPFAWGVADLSRNWWDWMETPFLMISTDAAPVFSAEDCQKLRAYTDAGGMIFLHNEYGSKEVDDFANDLAKRAYPDYPLKTTAANDLVFSTVFPMKGKMPLKSISNGSRTLLVYSPTDITQEWVRFKIKDKKPSPALQLGLNLFVAAAGKTDFRNRLSSPYEEPPDFEPVGTLPVFQVRYDGPWNPEHKSFERFSRWFQKQTSLKLDVQPRSLLNLSSRQAPVALLTGNHAVDFSRMDLHVLHDYVAQGGTLFIDATGGNKGFAASVRETLLPAAFPDILPVDIPAEDPLLSGKGVCMDALPKPRLRNFASLQLNAIAPSLQYASVGKGTIIISDLDITTGLLDSGTYGVLGYTPAYCQSVLKNVILWSLGRISK